MTETQEHDHPSTPTKTAAAEWDERFAGTEQLFSGLPNGSLVTEVGSLPVGRALDVGCGEGADAIWLAQQGWTVTGLDVSRVALDRGRQAAAQAGAEVTWLHAELSSLAPSDRYDLVTVHYPALPSSPTRACERALTSAVASGGLLLVVHHADTHTDSARAHGFDPADHVGTTDVIAALLDGAWMVEVDTRRPRDVPAGGGRHTHDVVLRARHA